MASIEGTRFIPLCNGHERGEEQCRIKARRRMYDSSISEVLSVYITRRKVDFRRAYITLRIEMLNSRKEINVHFLMDNSGSIFHKDILPARWH